MSKNKKFTLITMIAILVIVILFGFTQIYSLVTKGFGFGWKSLNPLEMPVILEDKNNDPNIADYELIAKEGETEFIEGLKTDTLGYNGSYLGPILRIKRGEKVNISVKNQLEVPTTLHWHGLLVDGEQDGGPLQGIEPKQSWNPSFIVNQPAATLWYHPHFAGTTANQVYFGLSGLIYIEDEISNKLELPKEYGVNDIPLIVQDRNFQKDGNFDYRTSMMGVVPGEVIIINGTVNPYLEISEEKIRLRVLNASNSEYFKFSLSNNDSFQQIASDGGFLEKPISMNTISLAPGERAEIIVDFKGNDEKKIFLMNDNMKILEFKISENLKSSIEIDKTLTTIEEIAIGDNPVQREFVLESMGISGTINGKYYNMERIDEEVNINETEIWAIRNIGGMMQTGGHPFHIHGTQFQIISRDGKKPPLGERGFKDTVFVRVGEEVLVRVRFKYKGIYMYHCHILEHEDNGMMGQFEVQ